MTKKSKFQKALKSTVDPKSFFDDFKTFINRGNVVDLAVGVIIGGAFSRIVSSLVSDIITPLLGILLGGVNFSSLKITIPNFFGANTSSSIAYGLFFQNIIDFVIIALSIFIFIRFFTKLQEATAKKSAEAETKSEAGTKSEPKTDSKTNPESSATDAKTDIATELALLTEIRDSLKSLSKPAKKS